MNKYKLGQYATLQGQIVQILDLKLRYNSEYNWYAYKIKLTHDNLTHWVNEVDLEPLSSQTTPQVLYGR